VYLYSAQELAKTSQRVPGGREQVHRMEAFCDSSDTMYVSIRVIVLNHYHGLFLIFSSCHW